MTAVHKSPVVAIILVLMQLVACTSRYRLDLYLISDETRWKIKVEQTQYIVDGVLGTPMAEEKIVPGNGNCIVLMTGTRGKNVDTDPSTLVSYDQYLRYRIYLQLPARPQTGSFELVNNSFVQLMGHYEVSADQKVFLPRMGRLVIDSISGKHLYGDIDGRFTNNQGEPVALQGKFKVKIHH